MEIIVRAAAEHELHAAATVLAEAFAEDPVLAEIRPPRSGEHRRAYTRSIASITNSDWTFVDVSDLITTTPASA